MRTASVSAPESVGPTWQRSDGSWLLPERTLGWQVMNWSAGVLLQPDGPNAGEPWDWTDEQARFLLWWYAVDEAGRFVYRRGVLRRLKGWGKDPFAAALAAVEFLGPCRFGGWDRRGEPIAVPHPAPWVQIAAVSRDQTRNTMTLFPGLFGDKDRAKALGVDLGKEIIYGPGSARIESVTSSPRALEGGRPTLVIANEALALDTPIPTPTGWTTMGALEVGSVVYGSDGRPTLVTGAHETQVGRTAYRVEMSNGSGVVASDGHLWWTRVAGSTAKPRIRTTQEMAADGRRLQIPRAAPLESPDVALPLDPYILGAWLGDGSTGACHITIGRADEPAMVGEFARRGVALSPMRCDADRAARRFTFSNKNGFGGDMGTPAARALRALPCFRDKHIPAAYMAAGTAQRRELLRGLMDTDGCATPTAAIFVGTERLARDVAELATSLGLLPYVRFQPDVRSRHGGVWRVHFRVEGFNPFSLPRKTRRVTVAPRREWVGVTVAPTESVPVRCISVDAPDSLFVAGRGIVTHNTHHWLPNNDGREMARAIARNLAKIRDGAARSLAITNAHEPGEESVAEADWDAWQQIAAGKSRASGFLYDSLEAPPDTDLADRDSLRRGLTAARGDSDWLDVDRLIEEILDPTTSPSMARRFYLNQIVAPEDAYLSPAEWARNAVDDRLADGDQVALFFDGSTTDDHTALVACRMSDGLVEPVGHWVPDGRAVDRVEVDAAIAATFARFDVVAFYADVYGWESYVDRWRDEYADGLLVPATSATGKRAHAIGWDMRGRTAEFSAAVARFEADVLAGELPHTGHPALAQHIANAKRAGNRWGFSIRKDHRESPRKIDLAVCAIGARMARRDVQNAGKTRDTGPREAFVYF